MLTAQGDEHLGRGIDDLELVLGVESSPLDASDRDYTGGLKKNVGERRVNSTGFSDLN